MAREPDGSAGAFCMKFNIRDIKPKQIIALILAVIIGIMFIRFFIVIIPKGAQEADTKSGVEFLAAAESEDGDKALEEVRAVQRKYEAKRRSQSSGSSSDTDDFKAAFKDILIVGDSIMEALPGYGILDSDQVISKVGANTDFIGDNMSTIVKSKPRIIVLHFGLNAMGDKSYAEYFINGYTKQIKALQKKLPKAKIYVDSIFPVSSGAVSASPEYKNIGYYNAQIKKMTKELKVNYIDHTGLWKAYDKNYYDADGIHPLMVYYTEQYLPTILDKVGANVG